MQIYRINRSNNIEVKEFFEVFLQRFEIFFYIKHHHQPKTVFARNKPFKNGMVEHEQKGIIALKNPAII
jgi:hypothetical protein